MSRFDYESAELDILDSGGDPDYLSHTDPQKRDAYLRKMGLRPEKYGGGSRDPKNRQNASSGGDSGCFLTSACVKARGLPDDCEELTVLRQYRDGYLRSRPDGAEEIREYYHIAPQIVEAVNAKGNALEIWNRVYEEMVLPCVRMIQNGAMEDAFQLYKDYTIKLADIGLIGPPKSAGA